MTTFGCLFFNCYLFMIYLFVAVLGLCCCEVFSLVAASGDASLAVVPGLFITVASLVVEHRLKAHEIQ